MHRLTLRAAAPGKIGYLSTEGFRAAVQNHLAQSHIGSVRNRAAIEHHNLFARAGSKQGTHQCRPHLTRAANDQNSKTHVVCISEWSRQRTSRDNSVAAAILCRPEDLCIAEISIPSSRLRLKLPVWRGLGVITAPCPYCPLHRPRTSISHGRPQQRQCFPLLTFDRALARVLQSPIRAGIAPATNDSTCMTQLRVTTKEIVMDMLRFGFHRSALRALITIAALLLAANAHAQDPCEQRSDQDPSLQVLSHGIRVPLNFRGCWQPETSTTWIPGPLPESMASCWDGSPYPSTMGG